MLAINVVQLVFCVGIVLVLYDEPGFVTTAPREYRKVGTGCAHSGRTSLVSVY